MRYGIVKPALVLVLLLFLVEVITMVVGAYPWIGVECTSVTSRYCPSRFLALTVPCGSGESDMGFERCVYLSMGAWYLVVRELISSYFGVGLVVMMMIVMKFLID